MYVVKTASRRWRAILAAALAATLVLAGGTAEAARRYDRSRQDTLLAGIVVGGVPVGGMRMDAATKAVQRLWEDPLDRPLTVRAGDHAETVTWRELGASTDGGSKLRAALRAQQDLSLWSRVWHRLTGRPLERAFEVERALDAETARGWLEGFAERAAVPARSSQIDTSSGFVELTSHRTGRRVPLEAAATALRDALRGGSALAELPVEAVEPAVRRDDWGDIILVRTGENRLYHYVGDRLVKSYRVATGEPDYPTPVGRFRITLKRRNPTWVNPAKRPGAWGWDLPARIGPGPGNPLGTRALNLNVSGIRIHGTSNVSSIGYNASHGCIRMLRGDVEELFERVDVGTPVVILRAGPPRVRSSGDAGPRAEGG